MYKLADGSRSNAYKEGDKFLVVSDSHQCFKKGDEVILLEDDGSSMPFFQRRGGHRYGCDWRRLASISEKKFTKADLKDGMWVTYRDGSERFVLDAALYGQKEDRLFEGGNLKYYTSSLLYDTSDCEELDIMKVEYMNELIWERGEEDTPEQKEIKRLEAVIKEAQDALNGITKG